MFVIYSVGFKLSRLDEIGYGIATALDKYKGYFYYYYLNSFVHAVAELATWPITYGMVVTLKHFGQFGNF